MRPRSKDASERLLQSAQRHIARHGLDDLHIQSLARDAGTSPSHVYKYFLDKDDLIVAVFSAGWDLLDDSIHDSLRDGDAVEPSDTIKRIVGGVFDALEEHTAAIAATVVLGQTVGSPLRDKMRRSRGYKRQERLIVRFAETCRAELPADRVSVVTEVIFGSLHRLLFCLTPYKNRRWLQKSELTQRRKAMEAVLVEVVEGSILQGGTLGRGRVADRQKSPRTGHLKTAASHPTKARPVSARANPKAPL